MEDGGEDARADALIGADPQRPGCAVRERPEVGLGRLEPGSDAGGVPEEEAPRLGCRDRLRPARPIDELRADDPLERRDLLADGRLRVPEAGGGATE
jgi:hypothetical protein